MAERLRAKSISSTFCQHGSLFVRFHDAAGEVIAEAALDLENAADFLEAFGENCEGALQLVVSGRAVAAPDVH